MTGFELAEGDLRDFREAFREGNIWSWIRKDPEALRFWHILSETPFEVRMHHGTGAVALLSMSGDRITEVRLLQGTEAESVMRSEGLRISPENRRKAKKFLRRGLKAAEAIEAAWPAGIGLSPIRDEAAPGGGELIRFRFSWGGVLEVETDPDGGILLHRLHEGGDALDLMSR